MQPRGVGAGGAQLCPFIAAALGAGRTVGAKPLREPGELGGTLGTPLPFQAAGQGEAEHGEEEEVLHVGGSAGLGRALRVRAAPRRCSYTNRYTLAPLYQRP